MSTVEWSTLASTLAFTGLVVVTGFACYKAMREWPKGARRAFFCLGLVVILFGLLAIINRVAMRPFELFNSQDAQALSAIIVWLVLVIASFTILEHDFGEHDDES